MSKIIIHNNSKASDRKVVNRVGNVMNMGFVSGENQYCWLSKFTDASVHAKPTRGKTHTFEVRDIE